MRRFFCVLLAVALLAAAPLAHGAGWGNVKGKFLYDGTPPTPGALSITKDKEYCGKFSLVDERLVVNPDNKGIANVVVMLYVRRGKKVNVHPDLKKASGSVELDNNHCRFDPHIAFVRTGQELVIKNSDTIGHNTKIDTFSNPATNYTIPAKGQSKQSFKKAEVSPVPVSCSIHPWMKGYLVIKDHPYVAVSNKDGEFEIKNLPTGKLTLVFWQEKSGYVDKVKYKGKKTRLRRGRIEVDIKDGETVDLGEILVDPDVFK